MRKRSFVLTGVALLIGLALEACSQPQGACVMRLGCMDDMTEAQCETYFDPDDDDDAGFFEGLSCVGLGFDAPQNQTRGILKP